MIDFFRISIILISQEKNFSNYFKYTRTENIFWMSWHQINYIYFKSVQEHLVWTILESNLKKILALREEKFFCFSEVDLPRPSYQLQWRRHDVEKTFHQPTDIRNFVCSMSFLLSWFCSQSNILKLLQPDVDYQNSRIDIHYTYRFSFIWNFYFKRLTQQRVSNKPKLLLIQIFLATKTSQVSWRARRRTTVSLLFLQFLMFFFLFTMLLLHFTGTSVAIR